jgi:hypothetical protein
VRGGINNWGTSHNVTFGPAKYQVGGFSWRCVPHPFWPNKTVLEPRYNLQLRQHTIKTMLSVKLLGAHLDRELRWHEQGAAALAKWEAWLIQTTCITQASCSIGASDGVCPSHVVHC